MTVAWRAPVSRRGLILRDRDERDLGEMPVVLGERGIVGVVQGVDQRRVGHEAPEREGGGRVRVDHVEARPRRPRAAPRSSG